MSGRLSISAKINANGIKYQKQLILVVQKKSFIAFGPQMKPRVFEEESMIPSNQYKSGIQVESIH